MYSSSLWSESESWMFGGVSGLPDPILIGEASLEAIIKIVILLLADFKICNTLKINISF